MNRRNFISRTALAAAGTLGTLAGPGWLMAAEAISPTRIRIIYSLHSEKQEQPDWSNKGFDFKPAMERVNQLLAKRCPGFEFTPTLATGEAQAKKILEDDKTAGNIDGYLVYQMNCWNRVVQTIATSGKPVLYADFQFGGSGGFLVYNAAFLREQTANFGFVASSDPEDLVAAVKCFPVVKSGGTNFAAATAKARLARTPAMASSRWRRTT